MVKVPIHELKARLSHFLRLVQNGETVIIMRRNIPVGEITPPKPEQERELGLAAKQFPGFPWNFSALEEPLSEEEIKCWEGPLVSDE